MEKYDYKGWKIPQTLHIFAQKSVNQHRDYPYPQAMIATSDKESAINTAKKWASNYNKEDYTEYNIENKDIELELIDSANCSSQGGKLSFWNCALIKDDMKVIVGIGADLLLALFKNSAFENGKCKSKIMLARYGNQWGAIHKNMKEYTEAVKDEEYNNALIKAPKTSNWEPGYEYFSKTLKNIYLFDLYRWMSYDDKKSYRMYWKEGCAYFTVYDKPIINKINISNHYGVKHKTLSSYIKEEEKSEYHYRTYCPTYNFHIKLPTRIKGEKCMEIDMSAEEIQKCIEKYREELAKEFLKQDVNERYRNLNVPTLLNAYSWSALPDKRPEIPEELLSRLKKMGCVFETYPEERE